MVEKRNIKEKRGGKKNTLKKNTLVWLLVCSGESRKKCGVLKDK